MPGIMRLVRATAWTGRMSLAAGVPLSKNCKLQTSMGKRFVNRRLDWEAPPPIANSVDRSRTRRNNKKSFQRWRMGFRKIEAAAGTAYWPGVDHSSISDLEDRGWVSLSLRMGSYLRKCKSRQASSHTPSSPKSCSRQYAYPQTLVETCRQ